MMPLPASMAVKYLITTDENAELTLYRADQLDITDVIPRSQYGWIRSHLADQLHVAPELGVYFYGFNLQRAPFAGDVKVRRALAMVIDREKLAQLVLRSGELPAYGWIPPGVADYTPQSPDYRSLSMAQRLAEARKLYAQGRLFCGATAALRAALQHRRGARGSSRSPSPPCGSRRSVRR